MLRRITRMLRTTMILAVLLAVSASVYQSWSAGSPGMGGWVQTEFGPLGPADRDLLVKVRLAGLWEGPTGQQAEQQASSLEVKTVGGKLSVEHAELDKEARRVADQLGVLLPSSPTSQQVGWMDEISQQTGSDYDRMFVQRLREAHGAVLPVIAEVRTSTRNDLMRQFAETADAFVSRHCVYLESTGLVDYSALPHHSPGLFGGGTNPQDLVVPILVFAAALLAAIALLWALRNRGATRRERITVPQRAPLSELAAVPAIPSPRTASDLAVDDTSPIPIVSDSGSRRWRSDTGPQRTVSDTGSRRAADSGSHRLSGQSGPRHSIRR